MNQPLLPESYFSDLLSELATRAARATVSRLGFSNPALRQYLGDLFSANPGEPGCFVGEPVFEATFGWELAEPTMESLVPSVLEASLVAALDKPSGPAGGNYRFSRKSQPYKHQLEAWNLLGQEEPRSIIVTSGTGSGKTECFMVPILNELAREFSLHRGQIEGVRALFLYPLNALIQSQQERLNAWTGPFHGNIRFCLYNGLTPNRPEPRHKAEATPNQVLDRETLRASPPPILVTNATMLEYMLVRSQDAPILQKSKGKLRWVVLDEAHTYIGSQAAELALLLRRVLHGFGVNPADVRFIATSATIGDPRGEAGRKLRDFLAGLAGVSHDRVHVVAGQRSIPPLIPGDPDYAEVDLDVLEAIAADEETRRFQAVSGNATALGVRSRFVPALGGAAAATLGSICEAIGASANSDTGGRERLALRWLDLLTRTRNIDDKESTPFLPLRLHAFHNVLGGLWACCDPACSSRQGTALDSPDWGFGALYTEQTETCTCGAPVYELRTCNDCNETYLWGKRSFRSSDATYRLVQSVDERADEFQLALDVEGGTNDAPEASDDVLPEADTGSVLIANRHVEGTGEVTVELGTQVIDRPTAERVVRLRVRDEDAGLMTCPECAGHHGDGQLMFRSARLGAPFLLMQVIPTLLEFCPDGDDPNAKPMRGRRMITFTDSRQGTARIAASLQQDAERNRVRSLVYQRVAGMVAGADGAKQAEREQQIKLLTSLNNPVMLPMITDLRNQLAAFARPPVVTFVDMAAYLAHHEADINKWALGFYRDLDPGQFGGDPGALELAKLFLAREFARRPKRANSLETMGLVSIQYPKLERVSAVPAHLSPVAALSIDEWRQLLKTSLDFVVREGTFIDFMNSWKRWIGGRFSRKHLLPPESREPQTPTLRRWPQCNAVGQQSRLVRLLVVVLQRDPTTPDGRDVIDSVLRALWDDLVRVELLKKSSEGRYLSFDDIAFSRIADGWLCPVTRRVLDVTLRGITPYLPGHNRKASTIECRKLTVPTWPGVTLDYPATADRLQAARKWLAEDPQVQELRSQGIWSNLNDRVLEGVRYFRTAEHSAQQSGARLTDYESKFKAGLINLLSCSTTMEMGVDIGGMSVVAMNNVPPHPANYLQRAGRAGRRGETRSVALTVCKNNPHDQFVFANPMWPFVTALPAPAIRLESPVIVQRHLNAMLLANFLWRQVNPEGALEKLDMEWWALRPEPSRAAEFMAAARCFDETSDPELTTGLRNLLRHTCFDSSVPLATLAGQTADAMQAVVNAWQAEVAAIDAQMTQFGSVQNDRNPAYRALSIQRKRLTAEYLLRELASAGFLPGYGFPTNITSFDLLNMEELDRQKRHARAAGMREDNKMRRRDLPSRDAVIALREYAPGSDVVIDGLVYRSAGITLNWHAPASATQVKEIQSIRQAWRCTACGASGTFVVFDGRGSCSACGADLSFGRRPGQPANRFAFIEPAGFAVDLYEPTHTDVSVQSFVPVESPWIDAEGEWLPLPNPALGSYRSSTTGRVFSHSAGINRNGYAICLECGRAEPMPWAEDPDAPESTRHLPKPFRVPHRRLRGAEGGVTSECKGSFNSFAIKPSLHLGVEVVTDVLELQLNGLDGCPMRDQATGYSTAVALRAAISSSLGVEVDEIGVDTKPIRHSMGGTGYAIVLYDHAGAGYCSSVADRLPDLLALARKHLNCPAGCRNTCQHCLLTYDTRFRLDDLDRFAALRFLSPEWMNGLKLRREDAIFGEGNSFAEWQSLPEAITREWDKLGARELRLHFTGPIQDWDIAASPIKRHLQRWSTRGPARVVLPAGAVATLSEDARFSLAVIAQWDGVTVHEARSDGPMAGCIFAEVVLPNGTTAFGSRLADSGIPAAQWGRPGEGILVRGSLPQTYAIGDPISLPFTSPSEFSTKAGRTEIRHELDGPAGALGSKLVNRIDTALQGSLLAGDDEVKTVIYRDRYLNAPLAIMLLVSFVDGLRTALAGRWPSLPIEIVTAPLPEELKAFQPSTQVFHNWRDTPTRDAAIAAAFDYCGMTAIVRNLQKQQTAHARMLEVTTVKGSKLKVWLDQGFGYWLVPRRDGKTAAGYLSRFVFSDSAAAQGTVIGEGKCPVEGQAYSTQIFFEKVT